MRGFISAAHHAALVIALVSAATSQPASGQQASQVPKFEIEPSPIALTGDARPHQYVGVIGRSAAWLGSEIGAAELWIHPLKLASDFTLDFRIPDYVDPVRGSDLARTVEIRPELTTITYSHATFTVRQHILAPLHLPGLVVLLDVSALRPLEVVASFKTVFQYAWPGAFGGQYAFWDDGAKAFVLSESLRERNAMIGSPWASAASTHPAHAIPDAPNTFVIPIDSARASREFIPIVIAAATAPRDSVRAVYEYILGNLEELYRERVQHADSLLEVTTSIDTPDDELDLAFAWSKVNLDESLTCNPDLGCGLVAGWGPSGKGTRPGFGWYFGGDAAINSFAMDATGLWSQVRQGLRFLARYRREDGKIPHEISQAAGTIPWFTDFPYTYYHADTTPYWIVAVWRYWRATGDDELVNELWDSLLAAHDWCLSRDTDGDGIIENGPGNLGAIEVGQLGENMHQDIYLAAVWIEALEALAEMGQWRGEQRLVSDVRALHEQAVERLNEAYWREGEGHHAFGILASGGTNDNLTVWPATALTFGLLNAERAERTLIKLAADSISADWGARILSTGSELYDPMHYNNGAVWPFVTGFVSWGQYQYRRPWAGYPLVDALKQVTFDWARGRHPELLSGSYYRPLDAAVPQQFFATSMLVSPVVYGMLGWDPDAPKGRARLVPQLPPSWDTVVVHDLSVADTRVLARFAQSPGTLMLNLSAEGPVVDLDVVLSAPPGNRGSRLEYGPVDGSGTGSTQRDRHGDQHSVTVRLSDEPVRIELSWVGGLSVEPPTVDLEPGQASSGLRVLDFRFDEGVWTLLLQGKSGREYALQLYGEPVHVTRGAGTVNRAEGRQVLRVAFPDGDRSTTVTIALGPLPD
jgi:hypothetical protein